MSAGLEVLFSKVQRDIQASEDCVVCAIHWVLITNGFKCLVKGEQPTSERERKSELLPHGWNESRDLYVLKYSQGGDDSFILKIVRADGTLVVNFMRASDEKIASVIVNTSDFATDDWSSFDSAFKDIGHLESVIKQHLLHEFRKGDNPGPSHSQPTSRPSHSERTDPDNDPLRVPPRHGRREPAPDWTDPGDPFSVGRGDLDPLRGGGGMMMDPFRGRGRMPGFDPSFGIPGRLPRGAVPPGARFDPFGPPGGPPGPRAGPDPDHARPPGWDDMYM
ncbi:proteasome inhibitor PI31 subunit-like [Liolophura sinensis]|uniref:proteasome inhibitor PI31 subunit-like n=1 Tax=Liolophura sinensis TaxID=3198878 RepID=UPI003159257C